ncbi:MAG: hypothetical protein N2652_12460 [Kiritimatiellae bacterium]|nr:hypothetical protein [Kiritimatiellia bacterium]
MKFPRGFVRVAVGVAVILLAMSVVRAGPKLEIGPDSWLQAGVLGQVQATHTEDASPETDFFLRRARIILSGQVMDGVQFFAETDSPNAGRNGAPNEIKMQDIFVDLRLPYVENHWFKAGLILLPFSFESRSGATTLLGHDYNFEVLKLPNTFVWRDIGAELHGTFWEKRIAYFVGVFDGYDERDSSKNPDADLRLTGHVALNVVGEAESGWFFNQCRLGKSGDYLSIGAGIDRQDKATLRRAPVVAGATGPEPPPEIVDSENWVVDVQSGFDLGGVGLTLNAGWYDWDNALFRGNTAFAEAGVLVGKLMPVAKYSWQDPDAGATAEDYTIGLHLFGKGHNIRGGLEYRWGDSPSQWLLGIQLLL